MAYHRPSGIVDTFLDWLKRPQKLGVPTEKDTREKSDPSADASPSLIKSSGSSLDGGTLQVANDAIDDDHSKSDPWQSGKKKRIFRIGEYHPDWNFVMQSNYFRERAAIYVDDDGINYGFLPKYSPLWNNADRHEALWVALPSFRNLGGTLDDVVDFPEEGSLVLARHLRTDQAFQIEIWYYAEEIVPGQLTTVVFGLVS